MSCGNLRGCGAVRAGTPAIPVQVASPYQNCTGTRVTEIVDNSLQRA
jgi:hypothetical protein